MLIWKIVLVIVVLIILLCLTRVGAQALFAEDGVTLDVRIGLIRFRAYPRPQKKVKPSGEKKQRQLEKEERAKAARAAKKAQSEVEKSKKNKPNLKQITELVRSATEELLPPLKRSLSQIGWGIRIRPLQLHVSLGVESDPAAGAQLYGEINAAVWAVMPALERLVDIPAPYIQVNMDFDRSNTIVQGKAGISIRIGTLFAAAFGIGIPAARWFLRIRKRHKTVEKERRHAASVAAGKSV